MGHWHADVLVFKMLLKNRLSSILEGYVETDKTQSVSRCGGLHHRLSRLKRNPGVFKLKRRGQQHLWTSLKGSKTLEHKGHNEVALDIIHLGKTTDVSQVLLNTNNVVDPERDTCFHRQRARRETSSAVQWLLTELRSSHAMHLKCDVLRAKEILFYSNTGHNNVVLRSAFHYNITPTLRSSSECRLALLSVQVRQYRLFSFVVPRWWNEQTSNTRAGASLSTFKKLLKTQLFRENLPS